MSSSTSGCRRTRRSVDGVVLCSALSESFCSFSFFCLSSMSDTDVWICPGSDRQETARSCFFHAHRAESSLCFKKYLHQLFLCFVFPSCFSICWCFRASKYVELECHFICTTAPPCDQSVSQGVEKQINHSAGANSQKGRRLSPQMDLQHGRRFQEL